MMANTRNEAAGRGEADRSSSRRTKNTIPTARHPQGGLREVSRPPQPHVRKSGSLDASSSKKCRKRAFCSSSLQPPIPGISHSLDKGIHFSSPSSQPSRDSPGSSSSELPLHPVVNRDSGSRALFLERDHHDRRFRQRQRESWRVRTFRPGLIMVTSAGTLIPPTFPPGQGW